MALLTGVVIFGCDDPSEDVVTCLNADSLPHAVEVSSSGSPRVFWRGVLFPGERVEVVLEWRNQDQNVQILVLPDAQVRAHVYNGNIGSRTCLEVRRSSIRTCLLDDH